MRNQKEHSYIYYKIYNNNKGLRVFLSLCQFYVDFYPTNIFLLRAYRKIVRLSGAPEHVASVMSVETC